MISEQKNALGWVVRLRNLGQIILQNLLAPYAPTLQSLHGHRRSFSSINSLIQDLGASAQAHFRRLGACLVARYPPIAAIAIPKIKGSFTCGQLPSFVVLTMALTISAPAKITDIITGT